MKNITFLFVGLCLFFEVVNSAFAQERQVFIQNGKEIIFVDGLPLLTKEDSIFQASLPVLKLPENLRNRELPVNVDNSLLPYFRPIFNQSSLECGQASGVAYTFTYEMDRLRNLPANVIANQYPTHFVFNWSNQGNGSACAFFDSWNIIREVGTPNVVDYGGSLNYGGTSRWMSGYDSYYRAMKNRMWEFYSISLKDEDGLTILKNWIDNHLDGSDVGGVGNIYCSYMSASQQLPAGTPEAGKYVLTSLGTSANHALCVVAYHDSIRWDYNNDGRYTNDEDINNDGIVDFRDWEIGGVKLANSYSATSWGNAGFAYCTYNALCRSLAQGGVWNQCVSVMQAKENTDPQLTFKVNLTHDSRNKIKVMAGVSPEANATSPTNIMEFPILNYQAGNLFMQGGTTVADKTLEFGLDVTPLLSFVENGQPATFFLLVDEDDSGNMGTGLINSWSVMNYTNGLTETPCAQTNIPLIENGLTAIAVGATVAFNPPEVLNADLPPATINEPYQNQMIGTQGTEPYRWYLQQNYINSNSTEIFPEITAQQLTPTSTGSGYATKQIDFEFPFYDKKYNKVYLHTDGYLMFEASEFPWTFVIDEFNIFRNLRSIAPYMTKTLGISGGGGIWYEGNADKATFRWKAIEYSSNNILNFAISIYPSGKIEFYYGSVTASSWNKWYAGVSEGNSFNYELLDISNTFNIVPNTKITIEPDYSYTEMKLTRDGLFHGTPTMPYEAVNIDFFIKDANGLRNTKSLPFFTDGINKIIIRSVTASAGGNSIIEYGENASVTVELQNISQEVVNAQSMTILTEDEYISIIDNTETLSVFQPGETKTFTNAFNFDVLETVPNNHDLIFSTEIVVPAESFDSHIYLKAYTPLLVIYGYQISDGNNGYLEPGEDADIIVQIKNNGGGEAFNVAASLQTNDPFITVNTGSVNLGNIPGSAVAEATFNISIDETTPIGHLANFTVEALAEDGFSVSDIIFATVGFITEDFETGDFSSYDWEFSGNSPWQISQTSPYEGSYCMESGSIGDNQTSEVFLEADVLSNSEISFYYKVSSEANYDFLQFSVDGNIVGSWAGNVGWAHASYPVEAGTRIFKWAYKKDVNTVSGSDRAWVDFIVFPPSVQQTLVVTAGSDISICQDQSAQMNAVAVNAVSFLWTSSGDGTFSDNTLLNPVYTPGNEDVNNSSAELTITAYDAGGSPMSDVVMVFIEHLPIVWAGNDASLCAVVTNVSLNGSMVNSDNSLWSTSGNGTFDNPANLTTVYHPGTNDLAAGSVDLTLTGFPVSPCITNVSHSLTLTLWPLPVVTFAAIENFCHNSPPYQLTEGSPAGGVYSGENVIDGWFYPEVAGVGTHFLTYTFNDNHGCENSANLDAVVDDCTGLENLLAGDLKVIPNPGNGIIEIQLTTRFIGEYLMKIYNSSGKTISQKTVNFDGKNGIFINLTSEAEGVYYLNLIGNNEMISRKLVIAR
jgi:hypothetical protein